MSKRLSRGFTLIELLVVILLIGIMVMFAVPRYMNLKDKATVASAINDLDIVRKLLAFYSTDYGKFPAAAASYDDLKSQLVDPKGQSYGHIPLSNTFEWFSYQLDANSNFVLRVRLSDSRQTMLVARPDAVAKE
jgi:prepilin-type N-terminal cleavage/methylation domain-containing protein